MDSNPITSAIKLVLTTFVRYAIVAVGAWLVKHAVMTQGEAAALQDPLTIGAIVAAILATGSGVYLRLRSRFKTNTALKMPEFSTNEELNNVVKQASVGQIISTAPPSQAQINLTSTK